MNNQNKSKIQLLLLEDIANLGNKGEIATAKPGFIRNFLLPQKKAVIADKRTIRMQEMLRKEREAQAAEDRAESNKIAQHLSSVTLEITVKNDIHGKLYGSVTSGEIAKLLSEKEGITLDKKSVVLSKPIKQIGVFDVQLILKEEVKASIKLKVLGDVEVKTQDDVGIKVEEEQTQNETSQGSSEETSSSEDISSREGE